MFEKILIIDDENNFLKSISIGLKKYGLKVETASNGDDGFFKFKNDKFNLVVCDINLPDMTGWEVASRICHECPETKIVFITAGPTGKLRNNFDQYPILQKPFVFNELLKLIFGENIL